MLLVVPNHPQNRAAAYNRRIMEITIKCSAGYTPEEGIEYLQICVPLSGGKSLCYVIDDDTQGGAELLAEFNEKMGSVMDRLYHGKQEELKTELAVTSYEIGRGK